MEVEAPLRDLFKISVKDITFEQWREFGFSRAQARTAEKVFKKSSRFYDHLTNHCYIDSDIRDVLNTVFNGKIWLDTHSCFRANFGPDGIHAKKFFGKDSETDGFVENWDGMTCYSNPPFAPEETNHKMAAKLIYEHERRSVLYEKTDWPYQHIVLHALKFINLKNPNSLWHLVKEKADVWFEITGQLFREWTGSEFVRKQVTGNRNVIMYFVVGPEDWRQERIAYVKQLFVQKLTRVPKYFDSWRYHVKMRSKRMISSPLNFSNREGTPSSSSEEDEPF